LICRKFKLFYLMNAVLSDGYMMFNFNITSNIQFYEQ